MGRKAFRSLCEICPVLFISSERRFRFSEYMLPNKAISFDTTGNASSLLASEVIRVLCIRWLFSPSMFRLGAFRRDGKSPSLDDCGVLMCRLGVRNGLV
jgi:hypothetical protein